MVELKKQYPLRHYYKVLDGHSLNIKTYDRQWNLVEEREVELWKRKVDLEFEKTVVICITIVLVAMVISFMF